MSSTIASASPSSGGLIGWRTPAFRRVRGDSALQLRRRRVLSRSIGALALLKSSEVEEVEGPPYSLIQPEEDDALDLSDRCWKDDDGVWLTDFPPPPGYSGYEGGDYGDSD